ncbi:hypothetical protein TNCV_3003721 [Trichonephila clavipes]|nr:hypothetical protein TNCV_3003721 [Trichonephila clavipes]
MLHDRDSNRLLSLSKSIVMKNRNHVLVKLNLVKVGTGSPALVNLSTSETVFLLLRKLTDYPLRLRLENTEISCRVNQSTSSTNHTWENNPTDS